MAAPLPLSAYRSLIRLDDPPLVRIDANWRRSLRSLLPGLGLSVQSALADPTRMVDGLLGYLAPLEPGSLASETVERVEAIAAGITAEHDVVGARDLPTVADDHHTGYPAAGAISMWVGDITRLDADAIVNAANRELLGCRLPHHPCIDNAIHSAAGPRLRDDCHAIIEAQHSLEPVGTAKITRGYALPANYVLHTVGPQLVPGAEPTVEQRELLASAYRSCLDVAAEVEAIETVAFCGISTGVFAFPKPEAARIALTAVAAWLQTNPGRFDRVVFDFFSPADAAVYVDVLSTW